MPDRVFSRFSSPSRAAIITALLAFSAGMTWYFHFVLENEVVFTHFFYIPIILGGLWWGRRGVWVALTLGSFLILSHLVSGLGTSARDLSRAAMMLLVSLVLGAMRDKYLAAEKRAREAGEYLSTLMTKSANPVIAWDRDRVVTYFNPVLEQVSGISGESVIGSPAEEFFPRPDFERLKSLLESGYQGSVEVAMDGGDGQRFVCLWSPAFIYSPDGRRLPGAMAIGQDITKRKWAEELMARHAEELSTLNERLVLSEARLRELNAAKDKFFSIISHDLRSPFMPLLHFSESLREGADKLPPDRIKELAVAIHESSRRLVGLVENLLEWSRLQTGRVDCRPEMMDLTGAVKDGLAILRPNAEAKSVKLLNEVPAGLRAWADPRHVGCVVQNLVSNAVKFTPPGGEVRVAGKLARGLTEVSVTDTGVGMDEETQGALFRIDRHNSCAGTEGEKGSGLGLIICRELLDKGGGSLKVSSSPGAGSVFTFALPAGPPLS